MPTNYLFFPSKKAKYPEEEFLYELAHFTHENKSVRKVDYFLFRNLPLFISYGPSCLCGEEEDREEEEKGGGCQSIFSPVWTRQAGLAGRLQCWIVGTIVVQGRTNNWAVLYQMGDFRRRTETPIEKCLSVISRSGVFR